MKRSRAPTAAPAKFGGTEIPMMSFDGGKHHIHHANGCCAIMRLQNAVALALPVTFLASNVAAVPSHHSQAPLQEHHQTAPSRTESRWFKLSNRIVETLWRPDAHKEVAIRKPVKVDRERGLPAQTFAQYGGDVVLRFDISTAEEAESLAEASNTLLLDVWEHTADWVDLRLAMNLVPSLLGLLPQSLQHAHVPLLRERDLAQAIFNTYPTPRDAAGPAVSPSSQFAHRPVCASLQPATINGPETNIFFADYQPLSVIQPWMRLLASLFPTHTRLISLGTSAEGREIPAFRIGVHPTNDEDPDQPRRNTVLIVAGLHAREWIGTSTANYIAYNLITGYGKNAQITRMLEAFDFVIVPTLNPDGYVYTWENDRLWRKSRQSTSLRFCPGMDLDHTFGFEWDGATTGGNPCSEAYAGDHPFQAVESQRLSAWAKNETEHNNVDFVGFLDLHSYSQQILYPYSYSCEPTPPGLEDLEELAMGLEKAIRLSQRRGYEVMPACEGNSVAAKGDVRSYIESPGGSALDFFYHEMRVRYAYQIKLRDRGSYGFLLPKEHIVPTGREILDAVMYLGSFLGDIYDSQSQAGSAKVEEFQEVADEEAVAESGATEEADAVDEDEREDAWVIIDGLEQEDFEWELKRRRRR